MPKGTDPHNIYRPHSEDIDYHLSKGFMVRYCEEECEINEVVMFRTELDMVPNFQSTEVFLECELFFSDLSNCGGPTGWKQNWK